MALEKISRIRGRGVYVAGDDIDTDRIIPARFMKCVTFDGLGAHMFHDVRYGEDGSKKAHPLNEERFSGASIMLSNSNFGCGSSREHAPQAISKSGFRALVAESFAEIFFGNATTLGIPCASLPRAAISALATHIDREPTLELVLDLEAQTVTCAELCFPFAIKESARAALLAGKWDPIGQLLEGSAQVKSVTAALPYLHF